MICAQPVTHTIKSGDSLWLIARDHGTTVQDIMSMNPGMDPYNLQIGTQIYVCENTLNPAAAGQDMDQMGESQNMTEQIGQIGQTGQLPREDTPVDTKPATHTVRAGDSIWLIAKAYSTTVQEIMSRNPGIDPYNLQVGTELVIREQAPVPAANQWNSQAAIPESNSAESWQNPVQNGNAGWQNQGLPDQVQNGNAAWQNPVQPEEMPPTEIVPEPAVPDYMNSHGGNLNQPMPEPELAVCPPCPYTQTSSGSAADTNTARMQQKQELNNQMRQAWTQHVYWIRIMMVSILDRGEDQRAVTARLLENPADIADIFAAYYPAENIEKIEQLLKTHLQDGASLVTALRGGDQKRAEELNRNLYANGQQLAAALGQMNPYYNQNVLRDMIYRHIDQGNRQTVNHLAKNYQQDIKEFDKAEEEALSMADYLAEGINQQFLG